MSRRPGRWWKAAGPQDRRPSRTSRARMAAMPSIWWQRGWDQGAQEVREALNGQGAYDAGLEEGRRECERLLGQVRRIAEAAEAARNGDPGPLAELGRDDAGNDLLDVAEAAGVTPLPEVDADQLVDDLERWLREQD